MRTYLDALVLSVVVSSSWASVGRCQTSEIPAGTRLVAQGSEAAGTPVSWILVDAPPADTVGGVISPDSTHDVAIPAPSPTPPAGPPDSVRATSEASATGLRGHGRPNPLKAAWKAALAYGSDFVYIGTSPLRMTLRDAMILSGVLGVGALCYQYDSDVRHMFEHSWENPIYDRVLDTGRFFEPLGLITRTHRYYQGAAILGWVLDVPLLRTIPGELLESHSIAGAIRQGAEKVIGRHRPRDGKGPHSFGGGDSFPSGHASVVCEVAAITSHHARHPLARIGIWGIATTACLQRIDSGGHWASDVLMGAAFGAYAGHTIARRNQERRHGVQQAKWYDVFDRKQRDWAVTPIVAPDMTGLMVRARL